MVPIQSDVDPKTKKLQSELLKKLPAWRKLEMMAALNATEKEVTLADLRSQYPEAGEVELGWRYVSLLNGEEFAIQFLGSLDKAIEQDAIN